MSRAQDEGFTDRDRLKKAEKDTEGRIMFRGLRLAQVPMKMIISKLLSLAGEMTYGLRALAVFVKDPGSDPSTHMEAQRHL